MARVTTYNPTTKALINPPTGWKTFVKYIELACKWSGKVYPPFRPVLQELLPADDFTKIDTLYNALQAACEPLVKTNGYSAS